MSFTDDAFDQLKKAIELITDDRNRLLRRDNKMKKLLEVRIEQYAKVVAMNKLDGEHYRILYKLQALQSLKESWG